ncbi:MAG: sigma-70 family RNA polymerase sigma factor [Aminipila sp.]
MGNIEKRIVIAQSDKQALDSLISDYIPFIKKLIASSDLSLDFDDMLSIAMLTFSNCVLQYDVEKGNFIAFATTSIRNRLIDEVRKQGRHVGKVIPIFDNSGGIVSQAENVSIQQYNIESQRQTLSYEIEELSEELLPFGITFKELPKICPKQERSRNLCFGIAKLILANKQMKNLLFLNRRLPQLELSRQLDISGKTIEKHRKYIITLSVLMSGDYPSIKAFLPQYKEVR